LTFAELLARDALSRAQRGRRLGVRLSPLDLSVEEAHEVQGHLRSGAGESVYVAISVPSAEEWRPDDRTCICDGELAAQLATSWRNRVRPAAGEWIFYASVRTHGRAGGLRDALVPVREDELLRTALGPACSDLLPAGFSRAARRADLGSLLRPRVLCDVVAEAGTSWETLGHLLPRLGLVRDSRLGDDPSEAQARLALNARLVRAAELNEVRHLRVPGPVKQLARQLGRLARDDDGLTMEELASLDLGELATEHLASRRAARKPRQRSGKTRTRKEAQGSTAQESILDPQAGPGALTAPEVTEGSAPQQAAPAGHEEVGTAVPQPSQPGPADVGAKGSQPSGGQPPVSLAAEPPRFAVEGTPPDSAGSQSAPLLPRVRSLPPPEALVTLLTQLHQGTGWGLRWSLGRGALPELLAGRLPGSLGAPLPLATPLAERDDQGHLARWGSVRGELLELVSGERDWLRRLMHAPERALQHSRLGELSAALLEAAHLAFAWASGLDDDGETHRVLASRETLQLVDDSGGVVVVLGPLHPLVLEDAVVRGAALGATDGETVSWWSWLRAAGRVLPPSWPGAGGAVVPLTSELAGLPCFATGSPSLSPDAAGQHLAEVFERYLALYPHARLGLRVLADHGSAPGVMAAALRCLEASDDLRIELLAPVTSVPQAVEVHREAGRLRLLPLPASAPERVRPHVHVHWCAPGRVSLGSARAFGSSDGLTTPTRGGGQLTGHDLQHRPCLQETPGVSPLPGVLWLVRPGPTERAAPALGRHSWEVTLGPSAQPEVSSGSIELLTGRAGGVPLRVHGQASLALESHLAKDLGRQGLALRPGLSRSVLRALAQQGGSGLWELGPQGGLTAASGALSSLLRHGERNTVLWSPAAGLFGGRGRAGGTLLIAASLRSEGMALRCGWSTTGRTWRLDESELPGLLAAGERLLRALARSDPEGGLARAVVSLGLSRALPASSRSRRWEEPLASLQAASTEPSLLLAPGVDTETTEVAGSVIETVTLSSQLLERLALGAPS